MNCPKTICLLALLCPLAARAAESTEAPQDNAPIFHGLTVEGVTDFPIDVGARVGLELPYRLRLSGSVGILPGPYVDAFNDVAVTAGWYSQAEANVIRAALQESLVIRIHAGWRPWELHGFYFDLGYGLAALGGNESSPTLLGAATGITAPGNSTQSYNVKSRLHMLDAEAGWEWMFEHHLSLRCALGFAGTIAANTTVTPNFTPLDQNAQDRFDQQSAAQLNAIYTKYVFTPVATVALGFRFF